MLTRSPSTLLADETRALLTRLDRVRPFALQEPSLPAAAIQPRALQAIESFLGQGRRELKRQALEYLGWLEGAGEARVSPREMHERYILLRLRFNVALAQLDLFSDAITQRSEHGTGVWLAGLDAVAAEALSLPHGLFEVPPLICYLDRGPGGAIRRARTRLPGGGENPVALIRIPRERMIGSGVASSLVHEAGHQGVALLDLIAQLRPPLQAMQRKGGSEELAWRLWERWISEILADLWGVARVGVAATLGLMGVVSVPRPFQFRITLDDPHPAPFVRVLLSCALGESLYPDPQWARLTRLWESFYPLEGVEASTRRIIDLLRDTLPSVVALLVTHRPPSLRGRSVCEVLASSDRRPAELRACWQGIKTRARRWSELPPTLALAVIAQARADGRLSPERETRCLARLLTRWALGGVANPPALPLANVRERRARAA